MSTHIGLFQSKRLSYGITSASGLFQHEMERILGDIKDVVIFFDDIVIKGNSREEHDETVRRVLQRLKDSGLNLKKKNVILLRIVLNF